MIVLQSFHSDHNLALHNLDFRSILAWFEKGQHEIARESKLGLFLDQIVSFELQGILLEWIQLYLQIISLTDDIIDMIDLWLGIVRVLVEVLELIVSQSDNIKVLQEVYWALEISFVLLITGVNDEITDLSSYCDDPLE